VNANNFLKPARIAILAACLFFVLVAISILILSNPSVFNRSPEKAETHWQAPDTSSIPNTAKGKLILYGRELVRHTAIYLGPQGKVAAVSNGMNCQNCHLDAGTRFFGNNYSAVASTYPKFRARSGTNESIEKRVNDCIERSLNGRPLVEDSKEMRAFVAYIKWVGKDVKKETSPEGSGLVVLQPLKRAADSVNGKIVYQKNCLRCHGENGEGMKEGNSIEWKYPPLAGNNSFNMGAGLFRISRFAGYVKANMPSDLASFDKPILTDEEAWDVAAYIVSMPHPSKDISKDWPDISLKPVDHPFGPYADSFSEKQHKYGSFIEMKKSR